MNESSATANSLGEAEVFLGVPPTITVILQVPAAAEGVGISKTRQGEYYLNKWQRERASWIVVGKAEDAVIIRPDPKPPPPPRPYGKYATDEERLEARRRQKRAWWKKHRTK
jgi:hypothetical protein